MSTYTDFRCAKMHAGNKNRKIKTSEFKDWVTIRHSDNSTFIINNAYLEIYKKRFLIVYSEHQQPIIFFTEDLDFAGYGKGMEACKNLILPGWYFYIEYPDENGPVIMGYTNDTKKLSKKDIGYLILFDYRRYAADTLKEYRKFKRNKKINIINFYLSTTPRG